MDSLVKISVALATAAILAGNLPKILKTIRKGQMELIQESKASNWPKALTLRSK